MIRFNAGRGLATVGGNPPHAGREPRQAGSNIVVYGGAEAATPPPRWDGSSAVERSAHNGLNPPIPIPEFEAVRNRVVAGSNPARPIGSVPDADNLAPKTSVSLKPTEASNHRFTGALRRFKSYPTHQPAGAGVIR